MDELRTDQFDRYTDLARSAVTLARDRAQVPVARPIGVGDVLLGLAGVRGVAAGVLEAIGISFEQLRQRVDRLGPSSGLPDDTGYTAELREVFTLAWQEAAAVKDNSVATVHLLLAMLRHDGAAAAVLTELGADYDTVYDHAFRHCTVFSHNGRPRAGREPSLDELLLAPSRRRRLPLPPETDHYRRAIAAVRARKEKAVDAQDFQSAAAIRDEEKLLLSQRRQIFAAWAGDIETWVLVEEIDQLYQLLDRLDAERHHHGDVA